ALSAAAICPPTPSPVASMIRMRRTFGDEPPFIAMYIGTSITPASSTGTMKLVTGKSLERTRSRYSRLAAASITSTMAGHPRLAAALGLEHGVLERLRVDRIEAAERLVEDHQLGIVQQRGDELHLLLHPPRQLVDLRLAPILLGAGEAEPLQPFVDARRGDAR